MCKDYATCRVYPAALIASHAEALTLFFIVGYTINAPCLWARHRVRRAQRGAGRGHAPSVSDDSCRRGGEDARPARVTWCCTSPCRAWATPTASRAASGPRGDMPVRSLKARRALLMCRFLATAGAGCMAGTTLTSTGTLRTLLLGNAGYGRGF
jgi:hypothetical protein